MTENDIHKCILSYGLMAFTKLLNELELQERFEECAVLFSALNSFLAKYPFIFENDSFTKWSKEREDKYYEHLMEITKTDGTVAKSNMEFYIKDIKQRLKL